MRVSIIVPVYNVEKYIEKCFKSIVNQTYYDIECIFVDDKSPDNSYEILSNLIDKYNGPIEHKIIRHKENKGLSGARNSGTNVAIGDYIYYLDSDDTITPNAISSLVSIAQEHKDVDVVQGNTKVIKDDIELSDWRNLNFKKLTGFTTNKSWIVKSIFSYAMIPQNAWNKLLRRDFIIDNKLFFFEGVVHEDEHWIFFVSKYISSIAFTDVFCYEHYIMTGSIMQKGSKHKRIQSILLILKDFLTNIDIKYYKYQKKYIYRILNTYLKFSEDEQEYIEYIEKFYEIIDNELKKTSCNFLERVILISMKIKNRNIFRRVTSLLLHFM